MRWRNAGYPAFSRPFDNDSAYMHGFPFAGPAFAAIPPTPEYEWVRAYFEEDGQYTTNGLGHGYGPSLITVNGNSYPFEQSVTSPESSVKAGNFWPIPRADLEYAFNDLGVGFGNNSPGEISTARWSVLLQVGPTFEGPWTPLSELMAPGDFTYDATLHELTVAGDPPVGGCFWTDRLLVEEDC